MYNTDNWADYELLDTSDGERLERWGDYILIRPDPQVIWNGVRHHPLWKKADGHYVRSQSGGGHWEINKFPEKWLINYKNMTFNIKPMGFKHTGIFPEQAANWDWFGDMIKNAGRKISVLNLFAYTGGATVAAASNGASVCHVDASKGIVAMAKENAAEPIGSVTLIGLCTDICVISNAMVIKATMPEVPITVDAACCAGVTPESHKNALAAMKMCQIKIVNE